MPETPILTYSSYDDSYDFNEEEGVCTDFIRNVYSCHPRKISFFVSTKNSRGALEISIWENEFGSVMWEFSGADEGIISNNEYRRMVGFLCSAEEWLHKHFPVSDKKRKLFVTLYDRSN